MTAVTFTGTDSCGNSPKNAFVAAFEEALCTGDAGHLRRVLAPDVELEVVRPGGDPDTTTGAEAVLASLLALRPAGLASGHLEAAVTHGKAAAAWGTWDSGEGMIWWSHTLWFRTLKATEFDRIRVFGS